MASNKKFLQEIKYHPKNKEFYRYWYRVRKYLGRTLEAAERRRLQLVAGAAFNALAELSPIPPSRHQRHRKPVGDPSPFRSFVSIFSPLTTDYRMGLRTKSHLLRYNLDGSKHKCLLICFDRFANLSLSIYHMENLQMKLLLPCTMIPHQKSFVHRHNHTFRFSRYAQTMSNADTSIRSGKTIE